MKKFVPYIFLILVNLIYGINFSVAKIAMPEYVKPFGFVLLRGLSAFVFFWLISFGMKGLKKYKLTRKDYFQLMACGFFGVCFNMLTFFKGLELTRPISASVLMTSTPIFVLILSFLILKNPITKNKAIGVFIGMIGAIIIILYTNTQHNTAQDTILGNVLVLINAFSYSMYLIVAKPLLQKFPPILVLRWIFTFGTLMILPFGFNQVMEIEWKTLPINVILAIGFVMLFVSCLTYLFNLTALQKVNPSTASVFIYSQPLFATIVALILGADSLSMQTILGTVLVFAGVYLVIKPNLNKAK